MIEIFEGIPLLHAILKNRKLDRADYRLMKYVVQEDYKEGLLLHNALTGQLLELSKEETEWLKNLPSADRDWTEKMVKDYFLVPSDENEQKIFDTVLFFLIERTV